MNHLSPSAQTNNAGIRWNDTAVQSPAKSGLYQTRNERNQTWFKYFDANYGLWYMSWAELQENTTQDGTRISGSEIARHVVSWAQHSKNYENLTA